METKSAISFLFLLQAISNANLTIAQSQEYSIHRCRSTDKASLNYQTNVFNALRNLETSMADSPGFYNASAGTTEKVTVVALCSKITYKKGSCKSCVKGAMPLLRKECPDSKEAVMWEPNCMVRYSDRNIFGVLDDWVWVHLPDTKSVANVREFDNAIYELATSLQWNAAKNFVRKYATYGRIYGPSSTTVYGIMECTPDLSREQCCKCLYSIILTVHTCCSGKVSAGMFSPNCYFRYSPEQFLKKNLQDISVPYLPHMDPTKCAN